MTRRVFHDERLPLCVPAVLESTKDAVVAEVEDLGGAS
jgi:hypothetical protein